MILQIRILKNLKDLKTKKIDFNYKNRFKINGLKLILKK